MGDSEEDDVRRWVESVMSVRTGILRERLARAIGRSCAEDVVVDLSVPSLELGLAVLKEAAEARGEEIDCRISHLNGCGLVADVTGFLQGRRGSPSISGEWRPGQWCLILKEEAHGRLPDTGTPFFS